MTFYSFSSLLSGAVQLIVGARLLLLALRTRAAPEALIGAGLLLIGVGRGINLGAAAAGFGARPEADMATLAAYSLSHLSFYVVWWYVFRRRSRWAMALCGVAAVVLAGSFIYYAGLGWPASGDAWGTRYNELRVGVAAIAFCWGAYECLGYYGAMRRRIRIGLAKPSTALRFLFWGLSMVATLTLLVVIFLWYKFGLVTPKVGHGLWTVLMLLSSAFLWLSFLPPAALRRALDRPAEKVAA